MSRYEVMVCECARSWALGRSRRGLDVAGGTVCRERFIMISPGERSLSRLAERPTGRGDGREDG